MARALINSAYRTEQSATTLIDGSNSANWLEATGTGVTKSTDSVTTWNGAATTKFVVPGTTSGLMNIGTNTTPVTVPFWDGTVQHQRLGLVFQCSDVSRITSISMLIGDTTFTNYYQGSVFTFGWQNNEWIAATKGTQTWTVNGSPTWFGSKRIRIAFTLAAGSDMTINVAAVVLAPRARPAIIFSIDDGYAECLTFLDVEFRARNMPCSYSIDPFYIDTAGYLTSAQLLTLAASPNADINNHGYNNQQFQTVGATQYMANAIYTREWLGMRGIGPSAWNHIFVGGSFDGPLLRTMWAAGFTMARNTNQNRYNHPWFDANYSMNRMNQQLLMGLDSALTISQAKGFVDQLVSSGEVGFVNGHKFAGAAGISQWAQTDMQSLLDYCNVYRRQGLLDVLSVSQYQRQLTQGTRSCVQ